MARKDDELLQTGHRPDPGRNHERGTPRIIWLALLVGIVGAFFLFRSPGGGNKSGIGENHSVITVPADDLDTLMADLDVAHQPIDSTAHIPAKPRSGQVEIQKIAPVLTPENPESKSLASQPAKTTTRPPVVPIKKPSQPTPKTHVPEIQPAASGPYLVQVGSFGDPHNADKEAARLQKLGWDARVKVSGTANGAMVYRVRIGYFANRAIAEQFIHSHRRQLRGSIAVHR